MNDTDKTDKRVGRWRMEKDDGGGDDVVGVMMGMERWVGLCWWG